MKHLAWLCVLAACGAPGNPASDAGGDDAGSVEIDSGAHPEDCLNATDDDLDGTPDCADPDCDALVVCVPSATGFEAGVVVAEDEACPEGFEGGETLLYRELTAGGCSGCECELGGPIDCTGTIAVYEERTVCDGDTAMTGGTAITTPITFTCTDMPVLDAFLVYGLRATITPTETCTATGSPMLDELSWGQATKFCRASAIGNGCAADEVCAPITDSPCALAEGDATCAGDGVEETWYTDADDDRECAPCGCSSAGSACDGVSVELGSDWVCGDGSAPRAADGEKTCTDSIYSPPARLVGEIVQPTECEATTDLTGDVVPTGQSTLCCAL